MVSLLLAHYAWFCHGGSHTFCMCIYTYRVCVKATITNYNLLTTQQLLQIWSLACVEIKKCTWITHTKLFSENSMNKHCYVRCMQKSVYSLCLKTPGPAHKISQKRLPKRSNESSSQRFDGKEQDKHSLLHKIEKRSGWRHICVQLPRLSASLPLATDFTHCMGYLSSSCTLSASSSLSLAPS